jgi:hypothetical protein
LPATWRADYAPAPGSDTGQLRNCSRLDPPSTPQRTPAGYSRKYFWIPQNTTSYTESLNNIVPALGDSPIDYAIPSVNSASASNYAWSSSGSLNGGTQNLEPIFRATNPDALNSQNQAAFYSGIAFGVAGAAAIAIIPELPKKLPSGEDAKKLLAKITRKRRTQLRASPPGRPKVPSSEPTATPTTPGEQASGESTTQAP